MMAESEIERRIEAFELAWQQDRRPSIRTFLLEAQGDSGEQSQLLLELIAIDLEFRWRRPDGPRFRLEDYRELLPELSSKGWPLDLIGQEYRVRRQAGDALSLPEYLERFPGRHDALIAEIANIDLELTRESGSLPPANETRSPMDWPLTHDVFHLRRMVGSGGAGKVYEAIDRRSTQTVAVKYLRKCLTNDPRFINRLLVEARMVSGLEHPGIVRTLGRGHTPAGSVFLVMEWVAGPNLEEVRRRREIPWREAVAWGLQVCDALSHAHERGVIHCDLKPSNLLLAPDGRVRLADFGLARSGEMSATWTADIEGTAPFMAPEQVSTRFGTVGIRTDVYGLGTVLYCLLTNQPPHVGPDVESILHRVASRAEVEWPTGVQEVPTALRRAILWGLCKHPDGRPESVKMFRDALVAVQT